VKQPIKITKTDLMNLSETFQFYFSMMHSTPFYNTMAVLQDNLTVKAIKRKLFNSSF